MAAIAYGFVATSVRNMTANPAFTTAIAHICTSFTAVHYGQVVYSAVGESSGGKSLP